MPSFRYADDAADLIRRLVSRGDVAPAARAGAQVVIDPAIAARAARVASPDFSDIRVVTPEAVPLPDYLDDFDHAMQAAGPDMSLGSPLWHQMDKGARAYDNLSKGRTANLRNQNPDLVQIARQNINDANASAAARRAADSQPSETLAAAIDLGVPAVVAAGGAYALSRNGMPEPAAEATGELTSTGGTADLAAESRPAPKVESSPAPQVSPRDQAQALIARLNKMRRDAGGEVPEAPQMMAEINRLMAQSNTQRNAMTPKQAQGSSDPHIQAQALIAQLNEMRRKAGGEVPQAQQIMAEVRRLQAAGDQRRNAAQTR